MSNEYKYFNEKLKAAGFFGGAPWGVRNSKDTKIEYTLRYTSPKTPFYGANPSVSNLRVVVPTRLSERGRGIIRS